MTPSPANRFSAAVSTWLLVEGVWGLFNSVIFGFLTTNRLHAAIHVVLGIVGLWTTLSNRAAGFLWFLGTLLMVVGILYFFQEGQAITRLLNVNEAVAILNLVIGLAALVFAFTAGRGDTGRVVRRI